MYFNPPLNRTCMFNNFFYFRYFANKDNPKNVFDPNFLITVNCKRNFLNLTFCLQLIQHVAVLIAFLRIRLLLNVLHSFHLFRNSRTIRCAFTFYTAILSEDWVNFLELNHYVDGEDYSFSVWKCFIYVQIYRDKLRLNVDWIYFIRNEYYSYDYFLCYRFDLNERYNISSHLMTYPN